MQIFSSNGALIGLMIRESRAFIKLIIRSRFFGLFLSLVDSLSLLVRSRESRVESETFGQQQTSSLSLL